MGRDVRRVPPHWEHPKYTEANATNPEWVGDPHPCYDETYDDAAQEWMAKLLAWEAGDNPDREEYGERYFWDLEGAPPDKNYYRPAFTEEPTWFQLYETVSEGAPVSPPFATEDELIGYLCTHGDYWSQKRRADHTRMDDPVPTREQATALVRQGGGFTMLVSDGKIMNSYEAAEKTHPAG